MKIDFIMSFFFWFLPILGISQLTFLLLIPHRKYLYFHRVFLRSFLFLVSSVWICAYRLLSLCIIWCLKSFLNPQAGIFQPYLKQWLTVFSVFLLLHHIYPILLRIPVSHLLFSSLCSNLFLYFLASILILFSQFLVLSFNFLLWLCCF